MKTKEDFPTGPVERVAKKAGAGRMSKSAAKALRNVAKDYAEDLARDIVAVSHHAERNTVLRKDVMLVRKLRTP
jgi:histone H3/H4